MKKINNLFKKVCLWSLVVTMASCDFLDTKPYDFVAPETFYQNEKDCTMALAGVYYTLVKGTVYGNNYSLMFSNTDDLSYFAREFDGNPVKNHGAVCNTHDAANAQLFDTWTDLYDGINNANVLLDNIDKAEFPADKEYDSVSKAKPNFCVPSITSFWYKDGMKYLSVQKRLQT